MKMDRGQMALDQKQEIVGNSVPKIDASIKATGEALFAADIYLPGMLFGKILRSKHAHARILDIDTSKAEKLPGVKAVVTWRDAPDLKLGMYTDDWQFFAKEKVRYHGDIVAAVAATDIEIAEDALALIEVEYEELPGLFDPQDSLKLDAPLIHEDRPGNIAATRKIRKGDVEKAFASAEHIFEDTYQTQMVDHCPIETHASVAQCDSSGKTTIWSSSNAPFNNRFLLSRGLQLPMSKLKIVLNNVGGAFGGKQDLMTEPSCILLSKKSGRPVKIVVDREEEFTASTVRHPFTMTYKTAVDSKGKILARKIELIQDMGAYNDLGEGVLRYASLMAAGPYEIENVWLDAVGVYTNKQVGGVMRGVGVPQVSFAGESQLDRIAEKIGVDPYEIRMINALEEGSVTANGQKCVGIGFKETLKAAKKISGYEWKSKEKNRGFGIASMVYSSGAAGRHDYSSAVVKLNEDGTVVVLTGAPDVGQGVRTTLAQIAAQTLGVKYENCWVEAPNTDISPVDMYGANASRLTVVAGNAVMSAAMDAKRKILKRASEKWQVKEEDLQIVQGEIFHQGQSKSLGFFKDVVMEMHRPYGQTTIGTGDCITTSVPMDPETGQSEAVNIFVFATHVAEVEVDPETGLVKVLNIWAAHDVGKSINPVNIEGQIQGGVQMGLGFALTENIITRNGKTLNPTFLDCKMMTAADMPEIHPIIVEVPEPKGPFGARGVGEATCIPTAAAVANAVCSATGTRINSLPLSPEKVLSSLKMKSSGKKTN
ncbi:xanthine dehydrogenase family protein molybdopterin-binding subunit [Desulforhopalus singaporensis]|uniref:CO or xanthine dehydrogenase, Mo-binding subunit n=1 Tax=Desulforhopalus singaporensis TaxID=91360 RepID=A0A1H0IS45_9BACT|nr:xanthine dehydrogenase family protein molybdopterin-binding subunit [Desulforhopalus singaporensis]SDO34266.1 CO or xanthine dehydrogenase, Mo-binding subunit [Desulforhopalus singaporensis]